MRKLDLKKETLAELTGAELAAVVGGDNNTQKLCISGIRPCLPTDYDCPTYDACFTTHGCA